MKKPLTYNRFVKIDYYGKHWHQFFLTSGLIAAAFAFFSQARLDPHPEHDGYMLATAIAVKEGKTLYVDVVSGYGPVPTWLQAFTLDLFGPELINIRFLSALVLTVTAALLYLTTAHVATRPAAFFATSLWVSFNPSWVVLPNDFMPQLPWPSDFFTLAILSTLYFYIRYLKTDSRVLLFATGVTLGFAIFTRIHNGLLLAFFLITYQLISNAKSVVKKVEFGYLLLGLLVFSLFPIARMWKEKSLTEFVVQSFYAPITVTDLPNPWQYLTRVLEYPLTVFGLTVAVVSSIWLAFRGKRRIITVSIFTLASLFAVGLVIGRQTTIPDLYAVPTFAPLYLIVILFFCATFVALFDFRVKQKVNRELSALLVVAASSFAGTYYAGDALHYWWVIAAFIPGVLGTACIFTSRFSKSLGMYIYVVPTVAALLFGGFWLHDKLAHERGALSAPVLDGMITPIEFIDDFQQVDLLLLKDTDSKYAMFCGSPLLGVWNGKYQISGNFVYGVLRQYGLRDDARSQKYYESVYEKPNPKALVCAQTREGLEGNLSDLGLLQIQSNSSDSPLMLSGMEKYGFRPTFYIAIGE